MKAEKYYFEEHDALNLKVFCVKNRIQIKDVAKALNITYQTLNLIMVGKRAIRVDELNKLEKLGFKVGK